MTDVERVYDEKAQYEWERLERHRTEFAVTMRAFADHLPKPPASILDIGGSPGRYAIALALQGYSVAPVNTCTKCLNLAGEEAREVTDNAKG